MITSYKLFTAPTCPACPSVKAHMLSRREVAGEVIEVSRENANGLTLARQYGITSVPQVVFIDDRGAEVTRAKSAAEIDAVIAQNELLLVA